MVARQDGDIIFGVGWPLSAEANISLLQPVENMLAIPKRLNIGGIFPLVTSSKSWWLYTLWQHHCWSVVPSSGRMCHSDRKSFEKLLTMKKWLSTEGLNRLNINTKPLSCNILQCVIPLTMRYSNIWNHNFSPKTANINVKQLAA